MSDRDSNRGRIAWIIAAGLALAVIGTIIAAANVPGTESLGYGLDSETYETGSAGGTVAGVFVAAVGLLLAQVGLMALAVGLGTETTVRRLARLERLLGGQGEAQVAAARAAGTGAPEDSSLLRACKNTSCAQRGAPTSELYCPACGRPTAYR